MLTEFQLTNFKAFAGPETIPIRPLTLIFGPNSSGKSSIFQCLLMLKQTIGSADAKTNLLIKGDLVDLGSYREFIHRHETERSFSFRVMIPAGLVAIPLEEVDWFEPEILEDVIIPLINKYRVSGLFINFKYDSLKKNTIISRIELFVGNGPAYRLRYEKDSEKDTLFELVSINDFHPKNPPLINLKDFDGDKDEFIEWGSLPEEGTCKFKLDHFLPKNDVHRMTRFEYNDELLTPLTAIGIEEALKSIIYIGPMREYPERFFSFSGNQTDYVGKSGKFVQDVLITNKEILATVNKWFDHLEMGYELKVASLHDVSTDLEELFALRLFSKSFGVHVSITDVGFGISQVLPVIIQSLISNRKTILIEQPEYHLHPRLQAELGDMFIEAAIGERRNTFLIETHSEHLILRILRRIRETAEGTLPEGLPAIKPEDVAVLYVQPDDNGSRIINIPVNAEGEFEQAWPEGFFPERAKELF